MFRRVVALSALCLAVGALSATALADPGKSPAFEVWEPIPFVFTAPDAFNPCIAEDDLGALVVTGVIELFHHAFERPNGSHYNQNAYISSSDNFGFVLPRKMVGPDVSNENTSNGVMTLSSIGEYQFQNPETKQRFKFTLRFHVTDVGGANVVDISQVGFSECLGPKVNGT